MATDLEKRTEAYVKMHRLLEADDVVCVGFSGGADSLCLLLLLEELRHRLGFRLSAAHVNHHLRGSASDEDEAFVRQVCLSEGIPLYVFHCRADEAAARLQCSVEEAGRLLRMEAWRRCGERDGVNRIALAHHRNDQAETVLFRAARGTSLTGLSGIRPMQTIRFPEGERAALLAELLIREGEERPDAGRRPGAAVSAGDEDPASSSFRESTSAGQTLIRPLLCTGREEIEEWLQSRGCPWQTDATNLEDICARNSIRHQIIPCLEQQVNREAVRHIADLAEDAEEADRFLREEAERRSVKYVDSLPEGDEYALFIRSSLQNEAPAIQNRILMEAIRTVVSRRPGLSPEWEEGMRDLGREQLRQLRQLQTLPAGKRMDLPHGLYAVKEYEGIRLAKACGRTERETAAGGACDAGGEAEQTAVFPSAAELSGKPDGSILRLGEWVFRIRLIPAACCPVPIPQKKYTKWLDYDKINKYLMFRYRKAGDWLVVQADGGRKKLKDYLIDSKIPGRQRDTIPLLTSGPEVFWIVGQRISERAKVGPGTEVILEISAERRLKTGEDR